MPQPAALGPLHEFHLALDFRFDPNTFPLEQQLSYAYFTVEWPWCLLPHASELGELGCEEQFNQVPNLTRHGFLRLPELRNQRGNCACAPFVLHKVGAIMGIIETLSSSSKIGHLALPQMGS